MQPRIYTYKITFEEVPHYYYGVHKEEVFDEEYWGSPITHKEYWRKYTPKKELLEVFKCDNEGWINAQEIEKNYIKAVYNTDMYCLNENCGGRISLSILSDAGKIGGKIGSKKLIENKLGIHGWSKEQFSENGKKSGKKAYELGSGIHGLTKKEKSEYGKKGAETCRINGLGIYGLTKEEKSEFGKVGGKIGGKISGNKNKEFGRGYCGLTKEERISAGKVGGKISGKMVGQKNKELNRGICGMTKDEKSEAGKKGSKITNSQKWICLETGYISTAGPLTLFQKKRGIDTLKRVKINT
jgi:hypothetical protein